MNKIFKFGTVCILGCIWVSTAAYAADSSAPVIKELPAVPTIKEIAEKEQAKDEVIKKLAEAPVAGPYDEFNRSTPRSSLLGLALAVKEKDFDRAVNYLDLRNLPFSEEEELDGKEFVRKLAIVAKRAMSIDLEDMSTDPNGHKDDSLPSYRDRITTLKTNDIVESVGVKLVLPARTSYIKELPDPVIPNKG